MKKRAANWLQSKDFNMNNFRELALKEIEWRLLIVVKDGGTSIIWDKNISIVERQSKEVQKFERELDELFDYKGEDRKVRFDDYYKRLCEYSWKYIQSLDDETLFHILVRTVDLYCFANYR